jgi:hypothetical protein
MPESKFLKKKRRFDSNNEHRIEPLFYQDNSDIPYNPRVERAVRDALERLSGTEREFVERFYLQGQSYPEIAESLNKGIGKVEGLHEIAIKKLRKYLAEFVKEEYDIEIKPAPKCILCASPSCNEINRLISSKRDGDTWQKTIRILKNKYQIIIKSPQSLIGHKKYHLEDYKDEK